MYVLYVLCAELICDDFDPPAQKQVQKQWGPGAAGGRPSYSILLNECITWGVR